MMKINMSNFTPEEIISHLEIYGDGFDGNIIRALNKMKYEKDCALEELKSVEFELNDDTTEIELRDEVDELQEKLDRIFEILKED